MKSETRRLSSFARARILLSHSAGVAPCFERLATVQESGHVSLDSACLEAAKTWSPARTRDGGVETERKGSWGSNEASGCRKKKWCATHQSLLSGFVTKPYPAADPRIAEVDVVRDVHEHAEGWDIHSAGGALALLRRPDPYHNDQAIVHVSRRSSTYKTCQHASRTAF